jgi:hypothetical protein
MRMLWTWGGTFFGYEDRGDLYTHDGRHVGRFNKAGNVFSPDGYYLGQVMQDRLISSNANDNLRAGAFTPYGKRGVIAPHANFAGYAMYAGFRDFPSPEAI